MRRMPIWRLAWAARRCWASPPVVGWRKARFGPQAALDRDRPLPGDAERRDVYDEDGDGFVSPGEAERYYRRGFGRLDDNHDGRLSRAELKPEAPGAPDLELASEELVGATEQEYVDNRLRNYNLRADRTIGMMSTADFGEMVGTLDPAISEPHPGLSP